MTSEIDVTKSLNKNHSNVLFSQKVQNWGLRPTSRVNYIQYDAVLVYKTFVRSCVALQTSNISRFFCVLKIQLDFVFRLLCLASLHQRSGYFSCQTLLVVTRDWLFWVFIIHHKWLFKIVFSFTQFYNQVNISGNTTKKKTSANGACNRRSVNYFYFLRSHWNFISLWQKQNID